MDFLKVDLQDMEQFGGELKPVRADVVQGQRQVPGQLRVAAQVRDDVAGELDAACSDERDRDHARQCCTGLLRSMSFRARLRRAIRYCCTVLDQESRIRGLTPALIAAR